MSKRASLVPRVVVVDDDPDLADALARLLGRDYQVRVFHDAAAVLDLLTDVPNAADVVLSDVSMPGMDGGTLFDRLTARRPALATRFVFLTAIGADERDALASRTGCEVLAKPVTASAIRHAVVRALARSGRIRHEAIPGGNH